MFKNNQVRRGFRNTDVKFAVEHIILLVNIFYKKFLVDCLNQQNYQQQLYNNKSR